MLVSLLCLDTIQAQSVTATLVGTVSDQSAAAIPKASLTLTMVGTNVKRTVLSGDSGDFTIAGLSPGTYLLVASHDGFKQTVMENVELLVNQTARVNVVLQVGAVAESVEVTGSTPLVASETSSVGQVINTNQIEDLPLKGRAVFNLALLSPGTAPQAPTSYAGQQRPMPGGLGSPVFSAGGGRDNANGYLVDGIEAVDPHYMTPSMFPPMDSMQEFKIQMNSYSAEFGRFAVQVNATTKSGSNSLHGTVSEFFRNNDLDAANFFTNFAGLAKSPLRYNLFGGTVGGPVIRNRTFIFGGYEGTRIRNGSTGQANVPTAAQWSGDFSRLGFRNNLPIFDPATTAANPAGGGFIRSPFPNNIIPASRITTFAKGIQAIYPLPQSDVASGNNFFEPLSNLSDNNQFITRFDQYFSDKTSLSARYNIFTGLQTGHVALPFSGRETTVHNQNLAVSIPHTFSSTTLGELRLGYNRPNYFLLQEGSGGTNYSTALGISNLLKDAKSYGVPSLGISGFGGIGDGTEPNGQLFNIYMLINQYTLIRGHHTIKFGGEARKTNYNDRGEIDARGAYSFTGALTQNPQSRATTGVSVADLLLGLPLTASGESTSLSGNFNSFGFYTFVQDDWKVSSRLTLNFGLRYELNTRYVEVQNRQSYFDRQFPGGRVLLAGTSRAFIAPNSLVDGPATPRGLFPANKGDYGPRIGLAFRPFGDNRTAIRAGYGIFYSMVDGQASRQLERNPPNGQIISLTADPNENSSAPGAVSVANLFPLAGTPASQPTIYTDIGARGDPSIQQWNLSIQRQLFQNFTVEAAYMGSKGVHVVYYSQGNQALLDANPANPTPILSRRLFPLWGSGMRTAGGDGITSYNGGYVKIEKRFSGGLSLLAHYTHGKALDYSSQVNETTRNFYDPRMGKGRSLFDIRDRVVFSATYELPVGPGKRFLSSNGIASQVLGNWQINTIVNLQSGFPYYVTLSGDVCNCGAASQTAQQVGNPAAGFTQNRLQWFNTAAFAIPANGTWGSSGRNILSGPAQDTVDLSLFKIVRISERFRLQIRPEFFNLLNRVNFGLPGSTVASPTYGVITSAGDARVIQLALRLVY
ncbi:MAG TPA: carboxypeptidase-like regulatory domain-containing protein [Candidatus Acidoferrales bacterium]|nr:carboxypeptidase-like regulatory domain-containing protein [Candidatus Acidoferrales bacterium]